MTTWMSTPLGHMITHLATAAGVAALGWGLWWYANRGVDTEEQVAAIDADLTAVEQDQDALWDRVEEIVGWLWALAGLPKPTADPADDLPATDLMPTVEAHAADMELRKLSTLHRGQHRETDGGRTVAEILAELAGALPHARASLKESSGALGEEAAAGPRRQGEP